MVNIRSLFEGQLKMDLPLLFFAVMSLSFSLSQYASFFFSSLSLTDNSSLYIQFLHFYFLYFILLPPPPSEQWGDEKFLIQSSDDQSFSLLPPPRAILLGCKLFNTYLCTLFEQIFYFELFIWMGSSFSQEANSLVINITKKYI